MSPICDNVELLESEELFYIVPSKDGRFRLSANELLVEEWLTKQLQALLKDLIIGNEVDQDEEETYLYNKPRENAKYSKLALNALQNLIEKAEEQSDQSSPVKMATFSFVVQMLVEQSHKNIYKKIFAIFDGV